MKKLLLIIPLMLLPVVAQAGKPEVIQLSPDTYMITKADHGGIFGGGIPKLKTKVIKQANEFAASKGKIAIPLASSERPMGNGPAQWATFEYQFRVVDKTDHEAQRTSLAPISDVTVSVETTPHQPVAPSQGIDNTSYIDELRALASLRNDGIITEEEFQEQKAEILARE